MFPVEKRSWRLSLTSPPPLLSPIELSAYCAVALHIVAPHYMVNWFVMPPSCCWCYE